MSRETAFALMILIMAAVTLLLRVLPFLVFGNKQTPRFITFLGKYLPFAIIAMLVVYCLKDISLVKFPFALPELISVAVVALLHIWRKNTLLSILCGTVCYMLLIQLVF